ncbi:DUF3891 family protein [Evansella sp. AB-rgal1]|uniref:DUF3891 family protein n=1 Tax=Evansella sp. AB-rgal1 TaxID=3242696 RepID=UPI00359CF708
MIVRERKKEFIVIEQHEHAIISGIFAKKWDDRYFIGGERRKDVELAIQNHDGCWRELDNLRLYIPQKQIPASFINYPLLQKIEAYRNGVDSIEGENKYAALLISMHYSSFFESKLDEDGRAFKYGEEKRQSNLYKTIHNLDVKSVNFHFDLLQFCDNLSLYICMNEWGCRKEEEISWFKDGFPQKLEPFEGERFYATWKNDDTVQLTPYPFNQESVTVEIPYKQIKRKEANDIAKMYSKIPYKRKLVTFVSE